MVTKFTRALLIAACVLPISASCTNSKVVVPANDTGVSLIGLGAELDPHFFSQNLTRDDGATAEDWYNIVYPRTEAMGLQRFRVMLQPHWWEPFNDNDDPFTVNPDGFTFDSVECQSVYEVLKLAQTIGADVTLVQWGCRINADCVDPEIGTYGRYYNAAPDGTNWVCRCENDEEFAENFVAFVKHVVDDLGFTCVKEITPYNEPDGNVSELKYYIPTVKALAARLKAEDLDDKVKLNLSDNTDIRRFYLRGCTKAVAEDAALFNSHTYIFGYEDPNRKAYNWEKRNKRLTDKVGKPHFVGEFGSNLCVGASRQIDINWYKRGVLIARNAINFLNAGAAGCSYWGLIDQHYGRNEDYAQMQQLGLWRYVTANYEPQDLDPNVPADDYACRPQYYAYSMLTNAIRKGARVYPLNLHNDFAAGTAVLNPDGSWSYVFANGSDGTVHVDLQNPNAEAKDCCIRIYEHGTLPVDGSMIQPSGNVSPTDGIYSFDLNPQTVVVLRTE